MPSRIKNGRKVEDGNKKPTEDQVLDISKDLSENRVKDSACSASTRVQKSRVCKELTTRSGRVSRIPERYKCSD